MADSSRHNLFFVPETTYGVTPAVDPSFADVRHTGTTLAITKESFQSEELHADRQIRDFRHGVRAVAGDVSFELSSSSFDDLLEGTFMGSWAGNVLKAGVTRRSFSLLRQFTDLTASDKPFHLFKGVELNTFSLSVPASGIVTGSFASIGQNMEINSDMTAYGTPTYGTPDTTAPFDSFTGTITEGGIAIGIVTEISLSLENGLAPRNVIGSDETIRPTIGRSNLTGNMTAYFENSVLLEKFLNETESSLTFTLADAAGNSLQFDIPKIVYNGGQPDVSGQGAITLSLPFQALYDSIDESQIVITRS